jgi:hypothetical protein
VRTLRGFEIWELKALHEKTSMASLSYSFFGGVSTVENLARIGNHLRVGVPIAAFKIG